MTTLVASLDPVGSSLLAGCDFCHRASISVSACRGCQDLHARDRRRRAEFRFEITRLYQRLGNTMIYGTHDQIEVMTLSDRIAIGVDPKQASIFDRTDEL